MNPLLSTVFLLILSLFTNCLDDSSACNEKIGEVASDVDSMINDTEIQTGLCDGPIMFEDPALEKCVLDFYDMDEDGFISGSSEALGITELYCYTGFQPYSSLSGLECAQNLRLVFLNSGYISDLSPIKSLSRLNTVILNGQKISDISGFVNPKGILNIELFGSPITDVVAEQLRAFTNLKSVALSSTDITSVEALAQLQHLEFISIYHTQVEDIAPLKVLKKLRILQASYAHITDPTVLLALHLKSLYLIGNPIDCEKYADVLAQLRAQTEWNDLDELCPP